MQFRSMSKTNSFSDWVNKKNQQDYKNSNNSNNNKGDNDEDDDENNGEDIPFLTQIYDIQTNLTSQMQELAGGLPEAGPLSAAFRNRMRNSIYLFIGSLLFGFFAIFIGIPTIAVRPSKFALCLTLSTLLAVASIVVLQKPSIFLENLWKSGYDRIASVVMLCLTSLSSIYITVFIHRYLLILIVASIQVLCIIWFLATFIPGGTQGLTILLRACYAFLKTVTKPLIYMCTITIKSIISRIFSE